MPRQSGTSTENNFTKGLITEASGLNFPPNACTETFDCVFNLDGTVERRAGFDFEEGFVEKIINRTDVAISTYLWKNVSGDGDVTLFVVQIGGTVYFYDTSEESISAGAITSNLALSDFLASGAPIPDILECQFSSGSKYLIITHAYCNPIRVSYDSGTQTITGTGLTLKIRDFEGDTADPNAIDNRPTTSLASMNVHHAYNLDNQGWTSTNLTTWDGSRTDMPSNVDVMWRFKNTSDAFDISTVANVISGNSAAPNGHFIMTLWDQNRDTASGLTGTTSTSYSYQRPTTSAWFAGRVFYSGLNYAGANSSIYFTQIAKKDDQYAYCYQSNDPTSEDTFDLLPDDGGVIRIPEAGTIFKLVSIAGAIVAFANNGIWYITGSTGLGFTATDYSVQKISTINAISASSFVDVAGYPAWWNAEGIYALTAEATTLGGPSIKSLTLQTIKTFYDDIPSNSKLSAKGFYHTVSGVIQWLYRSTDAATPTDTYSYDRILNFNVNTGAFYPWTIPASDVTVNGIVVLEGTHGNISLIDIVDDSANVIVDDSGNDIVSFDFIATSGGQAPSFKFLVSYPSGSTYNVTLAENNNFNYVDWVSYDSIGQAFDSYFITGYNIAGQGIKKFQPTWVSIYSNTDLTSVQYFFQALWDFAKTGNTGRWSTKALVSHTDTNYSNSIRRLKLRGHGKVLQFKIASVDNEPFKLAGWSVFVTGNTTP